MANTDTRSPWGLRPGRFKDLLVEQRLPADWLAGIADRSGVIIARTRAPELAVGRRVSAELMADISKSDEGSGVGRTFEGVPVYNAFARSKLTGWTVAIAVSQSAILAPVRRSLGIMLGGAAVLLLLTLGAAIVLSRRIAAPISTLAESAEATQRGEAEELQTSAVREVTELHNALLVAAKAARDSTVERERLEDYDQLAARTGIRHAFTEGRASERKHPAFAHPYHRR